MPHYTLAGHVFVCLEGEHVVFLDVHKDRYFALEVRQTGGLDALVRGWPVATGSDAWAAKDESADAVRSSVIALLLQQGLLSNDPASGKAATPVATRPITQELSAEGYEGSPDLGVATFWKFLISALIASLVLRFRGFERAVRRVIRRNERHVRSRTRTNRLRHTYRADGTRRTSKADAFLRRGRENPQAAWQSACREIVHFAARHRARM